MMPKGREASAVARTSVESAENDRNGVFHAVFYGFQSAKLGCPRTPRGCCPSTMLGALPLGPPIVADVSCGKSDQLRIKAWNVYVPEVARASKFLAELVLIEGSRAEAGQEARKTAEKAREEMADRLATQQIAREATEQRLVAALQLFTVRDLAFEFMMYKSMFFLRDE